MKRSPRETAPILLDASRLHEAGDLVARACGDSPFFRYVLPRAALRTRSDLARTGRALVAYGRRRGHAYATTGTVDGIALWLPPGAVPRTRSDPIAAAASLAPGLTLGSFLRVVWAFRQMSRWRRQVMHGPHWYLLLVAVNPSCRRQGIGSALIRPVLDLADAAGLPCYVEGWRAPDVLFYLRHDFQVVGEGDLPGNGPRVWTLRRDPRRHVPDHSSRVGV